MFVELPLQIVVGLTVVTSGVGFNVINKVKTGPAQLPNAGEDVGVTV